MGDFERKFAFRLALTLGWLDPDALLAEVPPALFHEWMAYAQLEPFGPLVPWQLQASMKAFTLNTHPFRQAHSKTYTVEDFMPTFEPPRKKSPSEIYAIFRTWALLNGAQRAPTGA